MKGGEMELEMNVGEEAARKTSSSRHRDAQPQPSDTLSLEPRKIPAQNVVLRLLRREIHSGLPRTHLHACRSFHQNVFPNFTVVNVEKPPCFLRKFSPDGTYFVAFSSDQTSIEIYEYRGPAVAEDLLTGARSSGGEFTSGSGGDADYVRIRSKIFESFFRLKHVVSVASNGEQLNRECSLFTDDGRFVIVGSASYVAEDSHPYFFDVYRNNESVSPNPRTPLEDYSLHLVDMYGGSLKDTRTFKIDKIFLSHNQGIYLYRDTLAVLSVQHQTIYIFQVTQHGIFIDGRVIGRLCYEDDELILSYASLQYGVSNVNNQRLFREATINTLKHRLLTFLYLRAAKQSSLEGNRRPLLKFYKQYEHFLKLRMWKMQLLDECHLLIKYATEDVVTLQVADPNSQPSFFVVYNMVTTEVLAVYENTSEDLLELFENFCDHFRNASLHCETQFPCSPSSNIHARLIQHRSKQTIINARFGGHTEAVKRLLAQLPISSQSFSSSPYLDLALFSYDDKWVSLMERPKACGDYPIRFYTRDSGLLKFRIHAGVLGRNPPPTARRLVAFTFHPYDPFAISVQRTNAEYIVNFHVRHIVC